MVYLYHIHKADISKKKGKRADHLHWKRSYSRIGIGNPPVDAADTLLFHYSTRKRIPPTFVDDSISLINIFFAFYVFCQMHISRMVFNALTYLNNFVSFMHIPLLALES